VARSITVPLKNFVSGSQDVYVLARDGFAGLPSAIKYHRETARQIYVLGVSATPLVLLSALFIGLVLALEWGNKLAPFGAKLLMGRIMSVGTIREIGPVITGLMMAGRTGAKIAAELGSMKVTEQISALTALDYLGFGMPPPMPSWGELIDQAFECGGCVGHGGMLPIRWSNRYCQICWCKKGARPCAPTVAAGSTIAGT